MSCISCGTPGTANITLSTPPTVTGQIRPGAVPRVCGMIVAPSGTCAWRRLLSAIRRPRALEHLADDIGDGLVVVQPDAHHGGDRVAGQVVVGRARGRRTRSRRRRRSSSRRSWASMRPTLSPTLTCSSESMPLAASARRSTPSWYRRSGRAAARSRPRGRHTASSSHRIVVTVRHRERSQRRGSGAVGRLGVGAPEVLGAAHQCQHDGDPQATTFHSHFGVDREPRPERESDRESAGTASCTSPSCSPAR